MSYAGFVSWQTSCSAMIKVGQGDWPDQDGNVPSQKAVPAIQPVGLARRSLNRVQDNRLTPSLCVQRHPRQRRYSIQTGQPRSSRVRKTKLFPISLGGSIRPWHLTSVPPRCQASRYSKSCLALALLFGDGTYDSPALWAEIYFYWDIVVN